MNDTVMSRSEPATAPVSDTPGPRRRLTFTKIVIIVACVGIAAMWIYAFGFASKKAAYRVDDAAWRARAEQICATYEAKRLELVDTSAGYIANPTDAQMLERADIVDAATDLLQTSLDEVTSVQPASERDRSLVSQYRGYYDMLLSDRRRYTSKLRALDLQPYNETKVDGGPVTNIITDFVIINEMRSCTPPGELGGDA
jgi:hypothetical protein